MKYLTIIPTGFELRNETNRELPLNSIKLSDDEYNGLLNGILQYINGKIIPT